MGLLLVYTLWLASLISAQLRTSSPIDRQTIIPVNTKHLHNICTTSAHRLRRWFNVVQMLCKCFVFTGMFLRPTFYDMDNPANTTHWNNVGLMLGQRRRHPYHDDWMSSCTTINHWYCRCIITHEPLRNEYLPRRHQNPDAYFINLFKTSDTVKLENLAIFIRRAMALRKEKLHVYQN